MAYSTKSGVPIFGLCIDWETSGSSWTELPWANHQGISFGAVIFKFEDFSVVDTLYREIQFNPKRYKWSMEAQAIHGLTQDYLLQHGVSAQDAAIDFASLLTDYFDPQKEIMFLGHNRGFDEGFTRQLLEPYGLMFKIHHVTLDSSGMGLIAMGQYKSNLLFDALGFEKRGEHNALDDALITVGCCERIRMLVNAGLGI